MLHDLTITDLISLKNELNTKIKENSSYINILNGRNPDVTLKILLDKESELIVKLSKVNKVIDDFINKI